MFSRIMSECVRRIYEVDKETQMKFLNVAIEQTRDMSVDVCVKSNAFFVPNGEYLMQFAPVEITNPEFGIYDVEGNCIWQNYVVFPVYDVANKIVGLGGFNPINYVKAHEENDWTLTYYTYSKKSVMPKGRYVYTVPGELEAALRDGYLIIVDGLFDALHLTSYGFHCGSLMGSSLTDELVAQLRFFRKVIVLADNDEAGLRLTRNLRKSLHNVVCVYQGETKDIDDLLKTARKDELCAALKTVIDSELNMDTHLNIRLGC